MEIFHAGAGFDAELRERGGGCCLWATFALADCSVAAPAGRFPGGFHGGFHGYYRGLYPYSLFGYPRYSYGGYYPYLHYEDDCRFEFPKRTAKGKAVQRGVWTCS